MKKCYYFVSYSHSKGFGWGTMFTDSNIFRIKEVAEMIEKISDDKEIVILYYKEISEEEWIANNDHETEKES